MELFIKFKKDYFNYLLSILLPAIISALSIPVLKQVLGSEGYGKFSIYFNAVLICTALLTGWLSQSIIRFYSLMPDKPVFMRQVILMTRNTQFLFFIPLFFLAWYFSGDIILALLMGIALYMTCMQFSMLAIAQSSFLSKKTIYSETIRVGAFVISGILLLLLVSGHYLYSLFIAVILSYLLSAFYLYKKTHSSFDKNAPAVAHENTTQLIKKFLRYGAPLSLWFVFAYLLTYVDKIFMLEHMGAQIQGNYQAIFDMLARTISLIISPVVISLFPLITKAYSNGEVKEIRTVIKKIIYFEIAGLILTGILYWWFGADVLFFLLKTPPSGMYKMMGLIIIAAAFVMQIAVVVHKYFELKLKSFFLLGMIVIAFLVQLAFYIAFKKNDSPLLYPLGYLIAAFTYLLLVSFHQIVKAFKIIK